MELLTRLSKESRLDTYIILLLSIISGVAGGIIVPLVLKAAQDIIAGKEYLLYAISLPLLTVLLLLTKRAAQKRAAILTENVLEGLFLQVANHVRHADLLEIERRNRSKIFLTMANIREVSNGAGKSVNVLQVSISLVCCWLYIVHLSPLAGFIILLAFMLASGAYKVFRSLTHDVILEETAKEQELFEAFHHILDGFKEMKINHWKNDDLFENYLIPLISHNQNIRTRAAFYFSDYHIFTDVCIYIAMGMVGLLLPGLDLYKPVATIFAVMIYQAKLILVLLAQLPDIAKGKVALEQLEQLAGEKISRIPPGEYLYTPSKEIVKRFHTLTLDNIQFEYQSTNGTSGFSVGPINLAIREGEILFIIGGNGSGKSTLMKVLTGLYPPSSGMFTLDGRNVNMFDYRYLFSAIFSDFHLFDRLYGIDTIDDQQIKHLLMQMELSHRVTCFEGQFSTIKLSTGQKKRLALIAAILEDKPVYVFDEWAADQAPHFRQYFYKDLLPSLKAQGKTIIAVSHDERYFSTADHVVKMDYGLISEEWRSEQESR